LLRDWGPGRVTEWSTLVRRVAAFTNEYPWRWQAADVEGFIDGCRNQAQPIVPSTGRLYEQTLRMFLDYATDPRYGWPATCLERFGVAPVQVLHEWNTVAHVSEFEGQPGRRRLTYDEVQALFDAADGRVGRARSLGRKGALVAMRDAAVLKTVYAYGLRRREAGGWTSPTCGTTRRCRASAGSGECSCGGASPLGAAPRSGAPS